MRFKNTLVTALGLASTALALQPRGYGIDEKTRLVTREETRGEITEEPGPSRSRVPKSPGTIPPLAIQLSTSNSETAQRAAEYAKTLNRWGGSRLKGPGANSFPPRGDHPPIGSKKTLSPVQEEAAKLRPTGGSPSSTPSSTPTGSPISAKANPLVAQLPPQDASRVSPQAAQLPESSQSRAALGGVGSSSFPPTKERPPRFGSIYDTRLGLNQPSQVRPQTDPRKAMPGGVGSSSFPPANERTKYNSIYDTRRPGESRSSMLGPETTQKTRPKTDQRVGSPSGARSGTKYGDQPEPSQARPKTAQKPSPKIDQDAPSSSSGTRPENTQPRTSVLPSRDRPGGFMTIPQAMRTPPQQETVRPPVSPQVSPQAAQASPQASPRARPQAVASPEAKPKSRKSSVAKAAKACVRGAGRLFSCFGGGGSQVHA